MSWFRPQRGVQRPGLWVSSFPAQHPHPPFSNSSFESDALGSVGCSYAIQIRKLRNTGSVHSLEAEKGSKDRGGPFTAQLASCTPSTHTEKEVDWASWARRQKPPGQFSLPTGFLSEETNYLLPFSTFIERYVKPWQDDMKIDRPLVMFLALSLHGELGIFKINLTWRWRTWATVDFWENTSVN